MNSIEKIKEIEKTINEMTDEFVRGFNKLLRLIESIKEKE